MAPYNRVPNKFIMGILFLIIIIFFIGTIIADRKKL